MPTAVTTATRRAMVETRIPNCITRIPALPMSSGPRTPTAAPAARPTGRWRARRAQPSPSLWWLADAGYASSSATAVGGAGGSVGIDTATDGGAALAGAEAVGPSSAQAVSNAVGGQGGSTGNDGYYGLTSGNGGAGGSAAAESIAQASQWLRGLRRGDRHRRNRRHRLLLRLGRRRRDGLQRISDLRHRAVGHRGGHGLCDAERRRGRHGLLRRERRRWRECVPVRRGERIDVRRAHSGPDGERRRRRLRLLSRLLQHTP